jgi:hypothetical protein
MLPPKGPTLRARGAAGVHSFGTAKDRLSEPLFEGITTTVTTHVSELEYRCFEALSGKPDALQRALSVVPGRKDDDRARPHAIFSLSVSQRSLALTEPGEEGTATTPANMQLAPQTGPAADECGQADQSSVAVRTRNSSSNAGHSCEGTLADPARPSRLQIGVGSRRRASFPLTISVDDQVKRVEQEENITTGKTKNAGRDWNFFAKFETPRTLVRNVSFVGELHNYAHVSPTTGSSAGI